MIRYRIYIVSIALFMAFGSYTADTAAAGETYKIKASCSSINTKWHEVAVGDVDGHVIGLYQNTQVWVSDLTGEKSTQFSRGTMDFNRKTGQGTLKGYGVMTYTSGEKRWASIEGKMVGKGKWEGTWTDIDGSGKFKGCKGKGTWKSQSMGRGISHVTAEGERTLK